MKQLLFLLFFALGTGAQVRAQASATAVLEKNSVETGDTFSLKILVNNAAVAPEKVDFSAWSAWIPADNILRQSVWRKTGAQWLQEYTLIAFDSAHLELPPLKVRLHLGDTALTNPLSLIVFPTPAKADAADAAPLREIRREAVSWLDFWPWYLGVFLLLAVGLYWRKKRRQPAPVAIVSPVAPLPVVSPREQALEQLSALEARQVWKKDPKEYYAQLSLILREFLEKQLHFPAMESTTTENDRRLKQLTMPEEIRKTVYDILFRADMVKYAQAFKKEDTPEKYLLKTRQVVEKTAAATPSASPTPAAS